VDYEELRYVLLGIGCIERKGSKGSHVVFSHPKAWIVIIVPIQKSLKRSYIMQVIKLFALKENYDEIIGRLSLTSIYYRDKKRIR